jgi:3-methyladenine DNA glycosylase AlkD
LPASGTAASRSASRAAREIREALAAKGSSAIAASSQKFFRDPVQAHGWKTAALRRFVHEQRRALIKEQGIEFVVEVADQLFQPGFNEAKTSAIFLLEQSAAKLGDPEFRLFESWLDRVENWSDHDGLTMYLLGPMMAAKPQRANRVKEWARSRNLWKRRAAAVSLIRGLRRGLLWREAQQVALALASDQDLMVQKGVGWMLREAAKANAAQTIPFLVSLREKASRLVLRTACETLKISDRKQILNP